MRRRLVAMRRVQAAALSLFEKRGFDTVTVEDIAQAAKVGPATVYRNFGTKERVVLWDEYDPMLLDAIRARLRSAPLIEAVSDALVATLDAVYETDRARILRRTRLMLSIPALVSASEPDREALRGALTHLFIEMHAAPAGLAAEVASAAIVATLTTAVTRWAHDRGKRPMRDVLRDAFAALSGLAAPRRSASRRRGSGT